ncbi:MAG: putative signal transducing protein [Gemmatimonadota bacterium]
MITLLKTTDSSLIRTLGARLEEQGIQAHVRVTGNPNLRLVPVIVSVRAEDLPEAQRILRALQGS